MIKIATIGDEENIRQEIVRYIKKGIGSIEGVEVDVYESAERYLLVGTHTIGCTHFLTLYCC